MFELSSDFFGRLISVIMRMSEIISNPDRMKATSTIRKQLYVQSMLCIALHCIQKIKLLVFELIVRPLSSSTLFHFNGKFSLNSEYRWNNLLHSNNDTKMFYEREWEKDRASMFMCVCVCESIFYDWIHVKLDVYHQGRNEKGFCKHRHSWRYHHSTNHFYSKGKVEMVWRFSIFMYETSEKKVLVYFSFWTTKEMEPNPTRDNDRIVSIWLREEGSMCSHFLYDQHAMSNSESEKKKE